MAESRDSKSLKKVLAASRGAMSIDGEALRHDLDIGARLKRSVSGNGVAWFAGAAVAGFLLSRISPTHRKVEVKAPKLRSDAPREAGKAAFAVTLLKFALDLAKPPLMRWVKNNMVDRASGSQGPPTSPKVI
jgi:hypothetical protein